MTDNGFTKEAASFRFLSIALRDALIALKDATTVERVGARLVSGWAKLSEYEKISSLRKLLKDTPLLSKSVSVTVGGAENALGLNAPSRLVKQLGAVRTAIVGRLGAVLKLEAAPREINIVNEQLASIEKGMIELHKVARESGKVDEINKLLKTGQHTKLLELLNKKSIKPFSGEAIKAIKNLQNVNNKLVTWQAEGALSYRQYKILSNSVTTLSAPGSLSTAISTARVAPLMGFVAFGALKGDTKAAIVEQKQIVDEIIKLFGNLSGNDSPAGEAWETEKVKVIGKLSTLYSINIKELENIDVNKVDVEDARKAVDSILGEPPNDLVSKLQLISEGYSIIVAPAFYSQFESGSQSTTQAIGESVDSTTGWIFGNVTAFNQIKTLAQKGLQTLPQWAEKIAKNAVAVASEIKKHVEAEDAEDFKPEASKAEASTGYEDLVKEAKVFEAMHDLVTLRIKAEKKNQIIKKAYFIPAAIGMVAGFLGYVGIVSELGNIIIKGYIAMGDQWDSLKGNVTEVTGHLNNFIAVDETNETEAVQFVNATVQMINDLDASIKDIEKYFPFDIVKIFKEGVLQEQKAAIIKLSKEIVTGNDSKLDKVTNGLKKILSVYNILIDSEGKYYSNFDKTVESYWHGFVEIFDIFTLFSGEAAISEFKRMTYKAKQGQAIATTLLNEIENVVKTKQAAKAEAVSKSEPEEEPIETEDEVLE